MFRTVCIFMMASLGATFQIATAQTPSGNAIDRDEHLKELLPVIQGIYDVFPAPHEKPPVEEVITLQTLRDISDVIAFSRQRSQLLGLIYMKDRHPFPIHNFGFRSWPETLHFVQEPGLRGCMPMCRALLLRGDANKVVIIETEQKPGDMSVPVKTRATEYSLDDGTCHRPEIVSTVEFLRSDQAINIGFGPGTAAIPALGLCFDYKSVDIPQTGVFLYLNTASPLWPEEFERAQTKLEYVPDPLRSIERVIPPKAFMNLETNFLLSAVHHIAVEYKTSDEAPRLSLLVDSVCISPDHRIPDAAVDLLNSTQAPVWGTSSMMSGSLCNGHRKHQQMEGLFPREYVQFKAMEDLDDIEIAARLSEFHKNLEKGDTAQKLIDLRSILSFRSYTPIKSQAIIDAAIPILRDAIIEHDQDWAAQSLAHIPPERLQGHKRDLDKIKRHLARAR